METRLPGWETVLVVVAHPDDESFGLGAVIGEFTRAGAQVHVVGLTRGEASTLGARAGDLREIRTAEFTAATHMLGVASAVLLDFPDGALTAHTDELTEVVAQWLARLEPDGLLIFHRDGVTGHPDHAAAGRAAHAAAGGAGLPVLEWTLPRAVAAALRAETGGEFTGHDADIRLRVDRARHRRVNAEHASQLVPGGVLDRRLELLGDVEYLLWTH